MTFSIVPHDVCPLCTVAPSFPPGILIMYFVLYHQSQQASSSGNHECPYKMEKQPVLKLSGSFNLYQSSGATDQLSSLEDTRPETDSMIIGLD